MKQQDRIFFRTFIIVLFVLIAISFVVYISASNLTSTADKAGGLDPREAQTIGERISPIGRVAVGEPPVQSEAVAAAPAAPRSGAELYTAVCAACHDSGLLDAPKKGDQAAWATPLAKGLDALVQSSINGINNMPARGGSNATDEEMRKAVIYLLEQSGHPQ